MSRTTKKKILEQNIQAKEMFDAKRDINPFWKSSLFSDVYLKNDVPREYKHLWENDEIGGFNDFYQGFVDLCIETEHETFDKWKEADTVKNWIVHVMDLLGWENNSDRRSNSYMDNESFTVVDNGRKQTYRPDLIYFDKPKHKSYTQKERDIDRKLSEARNKKTGTQIVVEAKYWDRLSQLNEHSKKDAKVNDSASALGPELQTLRYMEIFDHDFGILTDGKTWRLFHKDLSQGLDRRSFDFDLGNLRELALDLDSYQNEEKFRHYAKYFYYFFSKPSLIKSNETKTAPLVHEIFEYSKKYAHSIEEDLKKRFILTMGATCNALKESCATLEEVNLDVIRNVAESHLFNILFVKSCEVRRILPISSTQYLRLSLHEVIETIDAMNFDPEKDWDDFLRDFRFTFGKRFDWDGFDIFNRFINLYEIIHDGTAKSKDFGFEIEGFKESIFLKEEWRFAKKHKISNRMMVEILFNLNFIESNFKGRKYQQIPYSYFTPRQLGSIYESLLEFRLEEAEFDMVFTKNQWKKANLKSNRVKKLKIADENTVKRGQLFFSPDNTDRKISGSYYTPDYIVKDLIHNSLGKIVENMSTEGILNLTVCDPSMGSGHFLAGVIDYLVEKYRETWSVENNDDLEEDVTLTARKVLDSCIFGVDLNYRAVKLAKMSLWLMSATPGVKLERLDDQLLAGDSLIEKSKGYPNGITWEKDFKSIFKSNGFDAIVGNPPYLRVQNLRKNQSNAVEYFKNHYDTSSGNFDIYVLFIEKSIELLKEGGQAAFILPNNFLISDFGKECREKLVKESCVSRIVNFNDYPIFANVSTYPMLLNYQKGNGDSREQKVEYFSIENTTETILNTDQTINYKKFEKKQITLKATGEKVSYVSEEEEDFFKELNNAPKTFADYFEKIFQGISTSNNDVYILEIVSEDKKYFKAKSKLNEQVYKLEKDVWKRFVFGKNVHRNTTPEATHIVLFPYKVTKEGGSLIEEKVFKKNYPESWKYLIDFKKTFEARERGKAKEGVFYRYIYPKSLRELSQPKIVLRNICNKGESFLDTDGSLYIPNSVYGGILKDFSQDRLMFFCGLINSDLMWQYMLRKVPVLRGGYRRYQTKYMMPFPVADLDNMSTSQKRTYKKIVSLVEKAHRDNYNKDIIQSEIDDLFYKFYEINNIFDCSRSSEIKAA